MKNEEERPKPAFAGILCGNIIYWGSMITAALAVIGGIIIFVTKTNFTDPAYFISGIWQMKTPTEIWEGSVLGHQPAEHWYLPHLASGDGFTNFAIALGVFSVIPALIGAAILLLREKKMLFGIFALIAAVITIISMMGLTPLPS